MLALAIIIIAVVVAAAAAWFMLRTRPGRRSLDATVTDTALPPVVRPDATAEKAAEQSERRDGELTVDGDVAVVAFDVNVDPADTALVDVLIRAARNQADAAAHLQPDVAATKWLRVVAKDHKGGRRVLGTVPRAEVEPSDTFEEGGTRRLAGGATSGYVPELADTTPTRELREELPITAALADHLAAAGAPPDAGFLKFAPALLQAAGYTLTDGPHPGTFYAEREAARSYVHVEPADGRELPDALVEQFLVDARESGAAGAQLVTDGFVPMHARMRARRQQGVRIIDRSGLHDLAEEAAHRLAGL